MRVMYRKMELLNGSWQLGLQKLPTDERENGKGNLGKGLVLDPSSKLLIKNGE